MFQFQSLSGTTSEYFELPWKIIILLKISPLCPMDFISVFGLCFLIGCQYFELPWKNIVYNRNIPRVFVFTGTTKEYFELPLFTYMRKILVFHFHVELIFWKHPICIPWALLLFWYLFSQGLLQNILSYISFPYIRKVLAILFLISFRIFDNFKIFWVSVKKCSFTWNSPVWLMDVISVLI